MPPLEFSFALALSGNAHPTSPLDLDAMIRDVTTAVLGYLGYPTDAVEEVTGTLRGVLTVGTAQQQHRCDVVFRAHDGQLQIAITCDGGAEWRTTRPLP